MIYSRSSPTGLALLLSAFMIVGAGAVRATDGLESSVAMMAKVGACSSPSFSPDGNRLAFISNLSGIPQVWVAPTEGGWPELVTGFDDPVGGVSWSPDGAWLAFSIAPGGGLNEQVYIVHPDGTGLRRLTDGGKENNRLGVWTRDGRGLTIGSNRRNPAAVDSYLVDVASGRTQLVAESKGIDAILDISRNDRDAILFRLISRGDNNLFLIDLLNRREILLTPHEGPGSFSGVFSADGRAIYLASNKDRDLVAFFRMKLGVGGERGSIELLADRQDAELQSFEINDQGTMAALIWNVGGRSELAFLDLVTLRASSGPKPPAEIIGGLNFSRDGRFLAMTVSGAAAPQDIWILDSRTNRIRQLTHSPHAGVDLSRLVRPELVRFRAHDGLELSAWLYRAPGVTMPGPIVLSFHGGPEAQERPFFNSTYQALLTRGISVLAPNVRGSAGFGKRFVNLDNGALRVNGVKDIRACVDYVVQAGIGDPKRVGIMGGSYGGYMVMAGLAEYPELFAAGADLFGVVNFETFFAHTEPWMAAISKVEYGDPATEAEMLRRLSPIHKLDQVVAPTIVLHGANDTNVPVVEAEQVVASLKRRGVPVEYVLFPDEGHGFRKTPNRIRSTVSIVGWFSQYLKSDGFAPSK